MHGGAEPAPQSCPFYRVLFPAFFAPSCVVPFQAFAIIVGLGLDYEIFLLSRIVDERRRGWTDSSAVVRGVSRSGPIISCASLVALPWGLQEASFWMKTGLVGSSKCLQEQLQLPS